MERHAAVKCCPTAMLASTYISARQCWLQLAKVLVNDSRVSRDIAASRKALYTQRAVIDKAPLLKANVDGVVVVANGLKVFASMTHAQGSCWHHAAAPQPSHRHIGVGRRQVRQCLLWLSVRLSPRGIGGVPPAASRSVQPYNSLNAVPAQDLANELPVGCADEWLQSFSFNIGRHCL